MSSGNNTLLPRPSAKQWAIICALAVPLMGVVWKTTQLAAQASVRETIGVELRPIVLRIDSLKESCVDVVRYEKDCAANDLFHRDVSLKMTSDYKEIIQILRGIESKQAERDQRIMETLGRLQGEKK